MNELVDKTYMIPYPSEGKDALFKRLLEIHAKEKLDVIIPNFDAELFSFIKLEKKLEGIGIKTYLPSLEQFEERNKSNLSAYGEKYGVNVPSGNEAYSTSDLNNILRSMNYPVMIKGKYYDAYASLLGGTGCELFHQVICKMGFPVIVQEFIRGTESMLSPLGDGKGNLIAAVPMRKQYITEKGKAWGGITIQDPVMLDLAKKDYLTNKVERRNGT